MKELNLEVKIYNVKLNLKFIVEDRIERKIKV